MAAERMNELPAQGQTVSQPTGPGTGKQAVPALKSNPQRPGRADDGRPGGGQGRVDITGIMPPGIRIDPNITEGHPGYEESGQSEIIPSQTANGQPTEIMPPEADRPSAVSRPAGIASLIFGLLGGAFWWFTPLGMVLSLTGLILGVIGWLFGAPKSRARSLAVGGVVLSVATFVLALVIALLGLELVHLTYYGRSVE